MCPWLETRSPGAMMSWETFARIAEHFHQAEAVDLTGGGEPLKNPLLPEMVRAAKAAGCEVGFSSNGTRLTPAIAERLAALGLDWISFSVDAASAGLYERIRRGARFEQVVNNIAYLRDRKRTLGADRPRLMMVFVMMTGEQQNYHELPDFIDLAHRLGVEQVIAKNLDVIIKEGDDERRLFSHVEAGASAEQEAVQEAIRQAQQRAQALGVGLRLYSLHPQETAVCEHDPRRSLFFNWEGHVSPCITLAYAESRVFDGERVTVPCEQFGDIRTEPLEAIWSAAGYRRFRGAFEARAKAEQRTTLDLLLGGGEAGEMPAAPEGCRTCYYLYGV